MLIFLSDRFFFSFSLYPALFVMIFRVPSKKKKGKKERHSRVTHSGAFLFELFGFAFLKLIFTVLDLACLT